MIYLSPEVLSGLGEDTFWTWFNREFSSRIGVPKEIDKWDIVLQYSTLGAPVHPNNSLALLWELHPEMKKVLNSSQWDGIINKIYSCARLCRKRVVSSQIMKDYYKDFGQIDVLPIGINTDLFNVKLDKVSLRNRYGIPLEKKVGFWSGTTHKMKGFEDLLKYKNDNPDIYWIIVWKQQCEAGNLLGAHNFVHVSQEQLVELMNCSDFFLSSGLLRPYYLVEWEAMACNLRPVFTNDLEKDFIPSTNPRKDIFRLQWDRLTAKQLWSKYLLGFWT